MSQTKTARSRKNKRRNARAEAMVAIRELSDSDLTNMGFELGREMNQQSNIVNEIRTRLEAVRDEKSRRRESTTNGFRISDHAVLRYLERYRGVDTQSVREEIAEMALRSGRSGSGEQYARRDDEETGLTVGLNEITNVVTTVFPREARAIMDIPGTKRPSPNPVSEGDGK